MLFISNILWCTVIYLRNKNQYDALLFNLYMFRAVFLLICSSWYVSCVYVGSYYTSKCFLKDQ